MIRRCTNADFEAIETIINEAAEAYRGAIPADCWHEPYMTGPALEAEIKAGVNFWGWDESGSLLNVGPRNRWRASKVFCGPDDGPIAGRHVGRSRVGHPFL